MYTLMWVWVLFFPRSLFFPFPLDDICIKLKSLGFESSASSLGYLYGFQFPCYKTEIQTPGWNPALKNLEFVDMISVISTDTHVICIYIFIYMTNFAIWQFNNAVWYIKVIWLLNTLLIISIPTTHSSLLQIYFPELLLLICLCDSFARRPCM